MKFTIPLTLFFILLDSAFAGCPTIKGPECDGKANSEGESCGNAYDSCQSGLICRIGICEKPDRRLRGAVDETITVDFHKTSCGEVPYLLSAYSEGHLMLLAKPVDDSSDCRSFVMHDRNDVEAPGASGKEIRVVSSPEYEQLLEE